MRPDDNEEALSVRLTAFGNQTKPLTEYYRAKGLLRTIDASQAIDRVTAALIDAIESPVMTPLKGRSLRRSGSLIDLTDCRLLDLHSPRVIFSLAWPWHTSRRNPR